MCKIRNPCAITRNPENKEWYLLEAIPAKNFGSFGVSKVKSPH
jgi:hypothetical protein